MRDLRIIIFNELKAADIYRNSYKQGAMTRVVDGLLKKKTIGDHEYQHAILYGLEYVGIVKREVTQESP